MPFGEFYIKNKAVHTHNDTYILSNVTAISARRPFFGAGFLIAVLMFGFVAAFYDLLYPSEMIAIGLGVTACLFAGLWLGHLQLLSRDLRGSELGTAIWGSYRELNHIRRQIADEITCTTSEELS